MEIWILLISAITSLIAVIISAVSIYYTYLNRRNGLREKIYDEQVRIAKKIFDICYVIEDLIDDFLIETDEMIKQQLKNKIEKESLLFDKMIFTSCNYLDNCSEEKITNAYKEITTIITSIINENKLGYSNYSESFFDIEFVFQELLGIEQTNFENRKLLSSIKIKNRESR